MLEPISPSHIPEKAPRTNEEKPLAETDNIEDSEGYRFSFFNRSKKKKKHSDASTDKNVYNEESSVRLNLSPEAEKELERQRRLKEEIDKNQDQE